MSIAVAVKKNDQIVIAADTQDNFGPSRVPLDNYRSRKIIRVGSSYVAATGWGIYEDILNDYLLTRQDVSLETRSQIFSFFMTFWKDLHEEYSLVKDQTDEEEHSPFGDLDATFLIVNHQGIFNVSSNMSVTKFEKYFAIGSGADFSLGAIYALYEQNLSASEIASRAVECAKAFNLYCGGEVDLFQIELCESYTQHTQHNE